LAAEHRVAPWLAAALATDSEFAADARLTPIKQHALAQTFQTLRLDSELRVVVGALNEKSIPVVVLKGPVLAQSLYPEPGLRPFGDVDILIHERDLAAVSAFLEARGYHDKNEDEGPVRLHEAHGLFQRIFVDDERETVVEVHCDHLQIGVEPISMTEIWGRCEDVTFGRANARALEETDMFVQLCVHLHRHGFERLIWFKDLDLLVRKCRLDWAMVRERAEEQGCLDSVAYALRLLNGQMGTPLPQSAREIVESQSFASLAVMRMIWPQKQIFNLVPQRQWRLRRIVQFAPETGVLRGGIPSLLLMGRRHDKLRILLASIGSHSH